MNTRRDWTADELDTIGAAEELEIAPLRPDGSLRRYIPVWVVRVGDGLFVRSWGGHGSAWIQSALRRHQGRIRADGVERDVTFEPAADANQAAIDQAYRSKYARYDSVEAMTSSVARYATQRLYPAQTTIQEKGHVNG